MVAEFPDWPIYMSCHQGHKWEVSQDFSYQFFHHYWFQDVDHYFRYYFQDLRRKRSFLEACWKHATLEASLNFGGFLTKILTTKWRLINGGCANGINEAFLWKHLLNVWWSWSICLSNHKTISWVDYLCFTYLTQLDMNLPDKVQLRNDWMNVHIGYFIQ